VVLDVSINETFFPGSQVLVIWGYFYFFGGFSPNFLILKFWFFSPPKLAKLVEMTLEKQKKIKYFLNFWLKNDQKIPKKETLFLLSVFFLQRIWLPQKVERQIFYWKFLELLERSCQFYENKIKI
jgi:hypothetical protein